MCFISFKPINLGAYEQCRVTDQLVQNLLLTLKQKFHFGLACPSLARPKRNLCFEVNKLLCHPVVMLHSYATIHKINIGY